MKTLLPAVLFVILSQAGILRASTLAYRFTINTSSLAGQADNLDFQLVPGDLSAPQVTLQISNFSVNGGSYTPGGVVLTGDATGALPNNLVLDNLTGYNDAYQSILLGASLSFLAAVSGPGVNTPSSPGTTFGFSIYNNAGTIGLLTTSADGTIGGLVFNDLTGVAPYSNPATVGAASAATITAAPEPSTTSLLFMGAGLALVVGRKAIKL